MADPDALQDTIPVFCTSAISQEVLNEFFTQGLGVPELANPGADYVAVLIETLDLGTITKPTRPPVGQPTSYPFLDWSVEDVIKFSETHFDRAKQGIVPEHLIILDKQTLEDRTCVLVTPREQCDCESEGERLIVRADFRSSLILLVMKVTAVGGDNHFKPTGPDGVVRLGDLP